jgi:hypothetical protein
MTIHSFFLLPIPGLWVLIAVPSIPGGCEGLFAGCCAKANKLFPYPGYLGAERI